MIKHESILTVALLLVGVVIAFESWRLGLGNVHRPGKGFLPFFTGLGLSCVSMVYFLKTFLRAERKRETEGEKLFGKSILNVVTIFIALVIYIFFFRLLGYLLSTFMLLVFLFKAGGFQKWTFSFIAASLTMSVSYLVFCSWLSLRFPKGILGF